MSKFTPVTLEFDRNGLRIKAGDVYFVDEDWTSFASRDKSVDDVLTCRHHDYECREARAEANQAQLAWFKKAAAADDLYAALEALILEDAGCKAFLGSRLSNARAALAKARGES